MMLPLLRSGLTSLGLKAIRISNYVSFAFYCVVFGNLIAQYLFYFPPSVKKFTKNYKNQFCSKRNREKFEILHKATCFLIF